MYFNLIKKINKRDAILLYAFYALKLREDPNALRETSYERIAVELNGANCLTARGFAFTAAVVRSRVAELERAGAARREETAPGKFNLTLVELEKTDAAAKDACESETSSGAYAPEPNDVHERLIATRTRARKSNKINKLINKNFKTISSEEEDSRPTVDDVVAELDLNDPRAVSVRRRLLQELYEPGLHADLIDRTICALAKHYVSPKELKDAIRIAQEEKRVRETTNGFKGAKTLWQTFCLYVKSWYDAAGIRWTPTSFRREPAPMPRQLATLL